MNSVDLGMKMLQDLDENVSLMEFKNQFEIDLIKKIYANKPLLEEELKDTCNVKFSSEFNMTTDSYLFLDRAQLEKKARSMTKKP